MIIAIIYGNFTCENYRFANNRKAYENGLLILFKKTFLYIINIKIHGCLEIPYLLLVLNKYSISVQPCIILYLNSIQVINNFTNTHECNFT